MLNVALLAVAVLAGLPEGDSKIDVNVGPVVLDVYTYRPAAYKDGPLIVTFHGVNRNADVYRDVAKPLADQLGGIIVAPRFDAERFPSTAYQRGGVVKSGKAVPPAQRTFALVDKVVAHVRELEGRPDMPCYYIGHSAGGQFVVRLAAFHKAPAVRLIAVNPGTQLFPNTDLPYPFGFADLPSELRNEATLRRYLAAPLVLVLGAADTQRDANLDTTPNADKQGLNRYERNQRAFQIARDLANKRGWAFNWQLLTIDGIGHSSKQMFAHPTTLTAFTPVASGQ